MASFSTNVAANTTAKGPYGPGSIYPTGPWQPGQTIQSEVSYDIIGDNYYITYFGNFDIQQGFVAGGNVNQILTDSGLSPVGFQIPMQKFQADIDNEFFDINVILAAFGDPEAYFSYLFRGHDQISGSQFNDQLDGYKGNDFISGNDGKDSIYGNKGKDRVGGDRDNDKLWGGKSKDEFLYGEGYDKDKIMDWEKKKDKIVFDTNLVSKFKGVKKIAKEKKNKVIFDFGDGDKLVVKKADFSDFKKSSFLFEDFNI